MLHAMIMAGGGGTRFWPQSRQVRPKQFLTLAGDRTLLQQACDRLEAQMPAEQTWVITAEAHRAEAERQLPQLPAGHVVGEPCGRDTAACIGLGAALIHRRDPDAVMVVTPADHVIEPVPEFARAVRAAAAWDTPRRASVLANEYPQLEKVSIDYAVMEHAPEVLVLEAPYQWDDVGSWLALERLHPQDGDGNTVDATHAGLNTTNCVI